MASAVSGAATSTAAGVTLVGAGMGAGARMGDDCSDGGCSKEKLMSVSWSSLLTEQDLPCTECFKSTVLLIFDAAWSRG